MRYYMLDYGNHGHWEGGKPTAKEAAALRCGKFNSIDRARREIRSAVGSPRRFALLDRSTMTVIAES